ncbi:MAG TPA: glycerol-3-phosphate 1-O-acyltransferase PlsY [Gemmatimonadaceae bacterium]|nr:glycerol-3-phosphate 1-O-acyltransferase PlsY [Gemmatimonadaceae bacterium]
MHPLLGLGIAYLVGSIPSAYLAGKLRGVDLRQHGSGNLGATNVMRVLGWRVALPVFLADILKGALPVLLLPRVTATTQPELWAIAYGVAAIIGHVRPIFLLWKGGGKGVATAAGVFFALAPLATFIALVVFVGVLLAWGYVSLGSLSAAVALPLAVLIFDGWRTPVLYVAVIVALFVFWTHRANIGRLRRGEEHRFGRKSTA